MMQLVCRLWRHIIIVADCSSGFTERLGPSPPKVGSNTSSVGCFDGVVHGSSVSIPSSSFMPRSRLSTTSVIVELEPAADPLLPPCCIAAPVGFSYLMAPISSSLQLPAAVHRFLASYGSGTAGFLRSFRRWYLVLCISSWPPQHAQPIVRPFSLTKASVVSCSILCLLLRRTAPLG